MCSLGTYNGFDEIICSIGLSSFAPQCDNKFEDTSLNSQRISRYSINSGKTLLVKSDLYRINYTSLMD